MQPPLAPPPGGFSPPPVAPYPQRAAPPTSTEAILALVLSLVGFSTSCFPVALLAVYFGAKARRQARDAGEPHGTNATLGLVGMILGGVFGALFGLFWLGYAAVIIGTIVFAAASGGTGP